MTCPLDLQCHLYLTLVLFHFPENGLKGNELHQALGMTLWFFVGTQNHFYPVSKSSCMVANWF